MTSPAIPSSVSRRSECQGVPELPTSRAAAGGMKPAVPAASAAAPRARGQILTGSGRQRSWRRSTPEWLRRRLAVVLAATVVLWITATVVVRELHGTVQSVRGSTSAYLDVIKAGAALSDADRAAWQSFRVGEAQFTGPGLTFQDDITSASQDLQQVAALSGGAGSLQLATVSGQLVNYQALVEQADAAYRADIALGAASSHDLGYAYLTYATHSMRDPGGLLATVHELEVLNHRTVEGQLASPWAGPAPFLACALAGFLVLGPILVTQGFLRRRFRRMTSPALLAAAALVCGLMAWMAVVILPADAAFAAVRGTDLPKLHGIWQAQIQIVNAQAAALRAHNSGNASSGAPVGLDVTATQPAGSALDADLAAAGDTGGLPVGVPALAAAIATLAWLGIKPRMDEYRRTQ
jgi:hypothetical protein